MVMTEKKIKDAIANSKFSDRVKRMIANIKCKGKVCTNQRRPGSAWCQDCSDAHKLEQKKFQASLKHY